MTSRGRKVKWIMPALAAAVALAAGSSWAAITPTGDVSPANPSGWISYTIGYIGKTTTGTVIINAGSVLTTSTGYVGYGVGASGTLTVDGAGSTLNPNSGVWYLGFRGSGVLNITNGGWVSHQPDNNSYLGYYAGATGTAIVDGTSSHWENTNFYLGYGGAGSLTVTNGGVVNCRENYIGYNAGATGTVNVDGTGSTWIPSWHLYLGYSGTGIVNVTNGGLMKIDNGMASIGDGAGATGILTVDGTSSMLTDSGSLTVGNNGTGTLNITNGARVTAAGATILAASNTATGSINFGANGGTLTTAMLYAGHDQITGTGTINTNGMICEDHFIFDATHVSSYTLHWNNAGQNVTINLNMTASGGIVGDLGAGYTNSGTLTIQDGVTISSATACLGYKTGSMGMATVSGIGSAWTSRSTFYVGNAGGGALNILNGSLVTVAAATYVAANSTASSSINFGSNGGTLTTQSLYAVPEQFTGTGTINTRGLVGDNNFVFDGTQGFNRTLVWNGPGQNVTVNLDMTGASGPIGDIGAGDQGRGTLTISNGATVTSANGYLGYNMTSRGIGMVSGPGSTWNASGDLFAGYYGSGTLMITNSGQVNCSSSGYFGYNVGSSGTVTVDSPDSTLNVSSGLFIGYYGNSTMNIINGGKASNNLGAGGGTALGVLGFLAGSTGTVFVDGMGSTWSTGDLEVGYYGAGTLNITNGGKVSVSSFTHIGNYAGSTGTVTVDGIGSTWTLGSSLSIGVYGGTGALNITNGGTVTARSLTIGRTSLLAMNVGDGSVFSAGTGSLTDSGTIRLKAVPGLVAGVYTPITAGSWTVTGTVQALGGAWSNSSHSFIVTAAANGTAGQDVAINLLQTQRVFITDPTVQQNVEVGFLAATITSNLTMSALTLTDEQTGLLANTLPVGETLLSGWTFTTTGYTAGNPVFLSLMVGAGHTLGDLSIWHYDGTAWTPYAASDLSYDGTYANFTVTGFSGYAVAAVPEPAALVLLALGATTLLTRRRRRLNSGQWSVVSGQWPVVSGQRE